MVRKMKCRWAIDKNLKFEGIHHISQSPPSWLTPMFPPLQVWFPGRVRPAQLCKAPPSPWPCVGRRHLGILDFEQRALCFHFTLCPQVMKAVLPSCLHFLCSTNAPGFSRTQEQAHLLRCLALWSVPPTLPKCGKAWECAQDASASSLSAKLQSEPSWPRSWWPGAVTTFS